MILLALDTCDARGSVAVLRGGEVLGVLAHEGGEDYSSWLLPAVQEIVRSVRLTVPEMDVYAVASGPGSFTGLRVGLTTVKAWSEVFGKRIAPVSRLEALAVQAEQSSLVVAARGLKTSTSYNLAKEKVTPPRVLFLGLCSTD